MPGPHGDRPLILSLFEMSSVVHLAHGMWTHPRDQRTRIYDLSFWRELAQLLEYGTFDQLFLADVVGVYDVYGDGLETPVREGFQVPALDPLIVLGALADATEHLGLAATFSTTYEPPFAFARRIATLDQLARGRIGWNVVTSYLSNAARNFGLADQIEHDQRYQIADEYLDVVYKLLLGSWDGDAVIADRERRVYAEPEKVRYIDHVGKYFSVQGPSLIGPTPQRLPVITQAGSSLTGLAFAARHAELVFVGGGSTESVRANVAAIRSAAQGYGRDPGQIAFMATARVIVGRTQEEAEQKAEEYSHYVSTAIDQSRRGPDLASYSQKEPVEAIIARKDVGYQMLIRGWRPGQTVADLLAARSARRGRDRDARGDFSVIGTAAQVADAFEKWTAETGLSGFNLSQRVSFESVRDFVELAVPELRRRGLVRSSYRDGETLRERILGAGPGPHATHPSSRYLDPAQLKVPAAPFEVAATPTAEQGVDRVYRLALARADRGARMSATSVRAV
jgi:FMN-dependent oxidoreductase (nitrilotriacetate monooxygenase family)